jgi:hypothetical protein
VATTVTVRGATVAAASNPGGVPSGDAAGATLFYRTFVPGTTVPTAWLGMRTVTTKSSPTKAYSLDIFPNTDGSGRVAVGFFDSRGIFQELDATYDAGGHVTSGPTVTNDTSNPTTPPIQPGGPGIGGAYQTGKSLVTTVRAWADGLGAFLSVLTSGNFWKAVGIGAAGVGIGLVGVFILYKSSSLSN